MYDPWNVTPRDSGLGFWAELFKIGTSVIGAVGPSLLQYKLQKNALKQQIQASNAQAQQQPATSLVPQTSAAIPTQYYQQPDSLIPGVSNQMLLLGGAALVAFVLIANRRD